MVHEFSLKTSLKVLSTDNGECLEKVTDVAILAVYSCLKKVLVIVCSLNSRI